MTQGVPGAGFVRRKPQHVAEGSTVARSGCRKTVCIFDPEMHATLRRMAIENNVSFAEQVRTVVTWGLDSAKKVEL